jgi:Protein of unknown function (DUF3606)
LDHLAILRTEELTPDDREKKGKADRDRVSTKEIYEVDYEADKMGVAGAQLTKRPKRLAPYVAVFIQLARRYSNVTSPAGSGFDPAFS